MTTGYTLGVDIGSSSSKGVLVDGAGRVVASTVRPHIMSSPGPGRFEHDAESVWWDEFVSISIELTAYGDGRVDAVCTSGIGPCLLIVDEQGVPLRPAILYGVDTRATAEIQDIADQLGQEAILDRCGSFVSSQAVGPKVLWLRRHEPDRYGRAARWYMASSFLAHRLTGEYVLDHHSASQAVPFYDSTQLCWIDEWTGAIAPGLAFPRLVWPGDVVGAVTAAAATQTGLPQGTPVLAGTVDAWAEAVSVGADAPGDSMLMYGTSFMLVQTMSNRQAWPTLWGTVGAREGTYSLAAGLATGGATGEWVRQLLGRPFDDLLTRAREAGVGANGVLMLPYLAGERTPIFDADARACFVGLTLAHGAGEVMRAALEGTAFAVRHNAEEMAAAGARPTRIVAVGGGARSDLWTQTVSSVLGCAQELPAVTTGAAYGDAYLAALALGRRPSILEWNSTVRVVQPVDVDARRYDELYPIWRGLYAATIDATHRLAALQHEWRPPV